MNAHPEATTVIVATRDRVDLLTECLDSLLAQTQPPAEIVVVDSAPSCDATERMLATQKRFGKIVYVREHRPGLAVAHNRALADVQTPLVAFTDDDVIADPRWIAQLVVAFSAAGDVACVTGRIMPRELETQAQIWLEGYAGFSKGEEFRVFDLEEHRPDDPLFPFTAGSLGSGANMAFRTETLRGMGGFDPALGAGTRAKGGDDLSAFFEVVVRGHRLVYQPTAVVSHLHRRSYDDLRRQVYGYGLGLTAYLTKCALDRPRLAARTVHRLPRAAAHVLSRRSARNTRTASDFPRELAWIERRGMLAGPLAYVRSRRSERRQMQGTA